MVGDWIEDGYKKAQVTSITCDGIVETTAAISNIEVVDPIPLTEEILVKNGWRKEPITIDGDYADWYGEIPICQEEDEFNYERIELTYVHTLQHLLRLVGVQKEIEL